MKCISLISLVVLVILIGVGLMPREQAKVVEAGDFLRIHIRANSNSVEDQLIKYDIKNNIVEKLTPLLSTCNDKNEMIAVIKNNKAQIEGWINHILYENEFSYASNIEVTREYFPTRMYQDVVLESGTYDAIIVELGTASGNNWWCVVYPPLCFVNQTGVNNITYKSKLLEIIENFFK